MTQAVRDLVERWTAEVAAETDLVGEVASAQTITHELVERLARAVIIDLGRFLMPVNGLLENAKARLERTPESLPVVELVNVLACCGVQLHRAPIDLHRVKTSQRNRLAMIAIALGNVDLAARTLGGRGPYRPWACYEHDLRGAIGHWIDVDQQALGNPDKRSDAKEAWLSLIDHGEADATSMLTIGRLIEHRWGKLQVGFIADHMRELLSQRASVPETTPEPRVPPEQFPNATFLYGNAQPMWRDQDRVISINSVGGADHREKLPELFAYRSDGVLELESIDQTLDWTLVERLPANAIWLPEALARRDDFRARALDFGISAGKILLAAADRGVNLSRIRPEMMWTRGREVVALSDRAARLFELRRTNFYIETFLNSYRAPEAADDAPAVTFSLAACVSEWATGRYPFPRDPNESKLRAVHHPHLPLGLDAKFEAVLDAGLHIDPAKRMKLGDFVRKLEKLR